MTVLEGLALLIALPIALLLSGYAVVAPLRAPGAAGRLAIALLGGLVVQLLLVSAVNYARPLGSAWSLLCVAPGLATLGWAFARRQLRGDLAELRQLRRRELAVAAGGGALLIAAFLWPALRDPQLVFWDATSNHDSFFWITNAEHLKRHPYSEGVPANAARPVWNHVDAVLGPTPVWGRMGAEGLLALTSAATGLAVIKLYLWASAALLWAWAAAAYLLFRTLLADRARPSTVAALVGLQPLFFFTLANSNLPNLVGALCAALLLAATAHLLRPPLPWQERTAWGLLAALATHGLLCAYPELFPFAAVPCGLLAGRAVLGKRWHALGWLGIAVLVGLGVNGATTARACHGFWISMASASATGQWPNLLARLSPSQYLPQLLTLCVPALEWSGPAVGVLLTVLLGASLGFALARARDRFGALAALGGTAVLLAFTVYTGNGYGWQKSAQYGGAFFGALLPAGALAGLERSGLRVGWRRAVAAGVGALLVAYAVATTWLAVDTWRWARPERKGLRHDALALRQLPTPVLRGGRVLVVPESFDFGFFHGMWATYLLPEANLVFSPREPQPAGYLRHTVVVRPARDPDPVDAVFVSRAWADSFDANCPRLLAGRDFALLGETNLVLAIEGFSPTRGVPGFAATAAALTLRPARDATLQIALRPVAPLASATAALQATVTLLGTGETLAARSAGPPPWRIALPLRGGVDQRVELHFAGPTGPGPYPIQLDELRILSPP